MWTEYSFVFRLHWTLNILFIKVLADGNSVDEQQAYHQYKINKHIRGDPLFQLQPDIVNYLSASTH